MPQNWNGTLLINLDNSTGTVTNWLLDHGYALSGTTARTVLGWNLTACATDVMETVDKFESTVGRKPTRVIVWGESQGGMVARVVLQLFPKRIDGALPMCGGGAGTINMWNTKLDATFALDVLLGSQYGIKLLLNNISNAQLPTVLTNINQLVTLGQQTPQGRARIALAGALAQISTWNTPGQTEPGKDDYDLMEANVAASIGFALGTAFVPQLEGFAGGPFTWNNCIDYKVQLARSPYQNMVRELYKEAGLSLEADLDKLERAPRVVADPAAVGFTEKHNMTWTGELRQPVLDILTTGDAAGPISDEHDYASVVRYAGRESLLSQAFVDRAGHCAFTDGEQIAAFVTLFNRIDRGKWRDSATADELNELVGELQAQSSVDLGGSNFVQLEPPRSERPWDVRDWGTYRPDLRCKPEHNGSYWWRW